MQKTAPGGGIALRATLAALLALGSIPALSALPDYAPVAWAEPNSSSSDTSEITDPEIKNLDYAYKLELGQERLESKKYLEASSVYDEFQVEKQLAFFNKSIPNFTFEPCFAEMLNEFKACLNSNTNFVEIPVDTSYSEILQTANNSSFYNLLNTKSLSADVLTQTDAFGNNLKSCSDSCLMSASSAFKEKVNRLLLKAGSWSKQFIYPWYFTYGAYGIFNERNIFLGTSKTGTPALEISDIYGGLKSYYSGSIIDPSSTSSTNYQIYKGLGTKKTILETYKLLSNESQRISMKASKTFYRVQMNQEFKLGFEARSERCINNNGERYCRYKTVFEDYSSSVNLMYALGIDLPLHTLARLVKDVNVDAPTDKLALSSETELSDNDKTAIKNAYKELYVSALTGDKTISADDIRSKVANADVSIKQDTSDNEYYVYIKVPGIKTQKVKMKDIRQNIEKLRTDAIAEIDNLSDLDEQTRNQIKDQIKGATTSNDIDKIVTKAKLDNAKAKANKDIDSLKDSGDIDDSAAQGYKERIKSANSQNDIDTVVNEAKQAQTTKVGKKKDSASADIDKLTDLDEQTRNQIKDQIKGATTSNDIDKIVTKAKLDNAKAKANKEIDALPNLKDEEKKAFDKQVDDAPDAPKVADILAQAKKQNSDRDSHSNPFGFPLPEGYGTSSSSDAATKPEDTKKFATTPLYRLYNPWTGEHLFTTSAEEHEHLARVGWKDEGITGKVATKEGKPVHRLLNPTTGEHHYTPNADELKACIAAGWKDEGVHFYSNGDKPVYSMYNPNEQSFYHHYTSNKEEIAKMVKDGWKNEGVKWYCASDDE